MTQLLRADRKAFVRMQELSRDGIKPQADGTRPLDAIVQGLPQDHTVMYYMLPTQAAAPQTKAKPEKPQPKSQELGQQLAEPVQNQLQSLRQGVEEGQRPREATCTLPEGSCRSR